MAVGKVAVVVGVGPGTGGETAKRFAAEGYAIALITSNADYAQGTHDHIVEQGGKALIIPTDSTKEEEVKRAFKEIVEKFGASPEVLVFNARGAGTRVWPPPQVLDIKPADFQAAFARGTTAALIWIQQVAPDQIKAGKGTIILTGATGSIRGGAGFAMLSSHKFALRSLGQTVAKELQPKGIHVAHAIIDGRIRTKASLTEEEKGKDVKFLLAEGIAEEYWKLHTQHPSTWTQELDLRPFTEKF